MNNVSFGNGNHGQYFYEAHNRTSQGTSSSRAHYVNQERTYEPPTYYNSTYQPDSFEKKTQAKKPQQTTKKAPAKKAPTKKAPAKKNNGLTPFQKFGLFMSGLALGGGAVATGYEVADIQPKPEIGVYGEITDKKQLEYVANLYDTDANLILAYNGAESVEDLAGKSQVSVPKLFDPLQDKIEALQEKLYDDNLTVEEQLSLQDEIETLQDKQQTQKEVAWSYQDGKYVYFIMNETTNAEEFKQIYGIKDKALRRYNDLDCTYETIDNGPNENDGHYKDYTGALLYKGNTYKVKVSDFIKE